MNERITESYVRSQLRNAGYYDDEEFIIEEQISENPIIKKLLKTASKRGTGSGYPEFIIRSKKISDLVIIVEGL